MSGDADLYDRDFVAWTEAQAAELRAAAGARVNLPIDWENVAEEIESLGNNNRRELESRPTTVIEHLLKLRWSPAIEPVPGWRGAIVRERREIENLLEQSPSLRRRIPELLEHVYRTASELVEIDLTSRGEMSAAEAKCMRDDGFAAEQVLADWWPERVVDNGLANSPG